MKKVLVFVLAVLGICHSALMIVYAAETKAPSTSADAAVVMDAETGQVLYAKNMDKQLQPASITKILSAILAAELGNMSDTITISQGALEDVPWYSSHIALQPGEQLPLGDAMYAMMLASANDATNGIAEYIGRKNMPNGQQAAAQEAIAYFVGMMNAKAQQIGAANSHFMNPHGLIDPQHYTTAYDMAIMTKYAIQNSTFMTYFGSPTYHMKATNLNVDRELANQNDMIKKNNRYAYDGAIGGKVGYTEEALSTMVTVARRGSRTLICVVLKVPDPLTTKFDETAKLFDFCFDHYRKVDVTAEKIISQKVQFLRDGEPVEEGTVSLSSAYPLYLMDGLSIEDVDISYNFQGAMAETENFSPRAVLRLKSQRDAVPDPLAEIRLAYSTAAKAQAPAGDVPVGQDQNPIWGVFIAIFKLLGVLAVIFIIFVLAVRQINLNKRKRRRKSPGGSRGSSQRRPSRSAGGSQIRGMPLPEQEDWGWDPRYGGTARGNSRRTAESKPQNRRKSPRR